MKKLFSKIMTALLAFSMLAMLPACGPTPNANNGIKTSDLNKYTIVYPASYEDWQMEEVTLLQKAIKHVTGSDIVAVPDTNEEKDNEIIFASSSRQTKLKEQTQSLASEMDYIIAVSDGDIILGGRSYYGDMKAAYDFINNYLGYNDLEDSYGEAKAEISGTETKTYTEPAFTIMVANPGKYPFSCAKDVKVMADAGFNMTKLDVTNFSPESFRTYAKWCARFNVRIIQKSVYNVKTKSFAINEQDFAVNNPIIYGHYARYETKSDLLDMYSEMCDIYKENYSQYGWKLVMNLSIDGEAISGAVYDEAINNNALFKNADVISAKAYFGTGTGSYSRQNSWLEYIRQFKNIAQRNGNDMWMTIASNDSRMDGEFQKIQNIFRWNAYIGLCFGVNGVEYSLYKRGNVINDDYSKGPRYDDIKEINEELLKMSEAYLQYEHIGVYTVDPNEDNDPFIQIQNPYTDFDNVITEFIPAPGFESPVLFGCFKSKDSDNKYAFAAVNLAPLTENKTIAPPSSFALNAKNVTIYTNGDPTELALAKTGYYPVAIANGSGIFITVEQ